MFGGRINPKINLKDHVVNKQSIKDINLADKRIIMRVDFNVPVENGEIMDDTRILAAIPSIEYSLKHDTSLVLMSHLGRPGGNGFEEKYSLKPVAEHLGSLLNKPVKMAPDCIGSDIQLLVDSMNPGEVVMLENTRFHAEETAKISDGKDQILKQENMARQLANLGDIFVNDAFGTAHRAHASTSIITKYIDAAVAGLLMEKELIFLGNAIEAPDRPFTAIIGGAKISGKLDLLKSLIQKVDSLIIGGGMSYTFKKAKGFKIGKSIVENDLIDIALETLDTAEKLGKTILLPIDNVIADDFDENANIQTLSGDFPDGWEGVDIGKDSIALFCEEIRKAKTILWNGPMGCFEMKPFSHGTTAVCNAVAASDAVSIIGGGDSVSAVKQAGLFENMTHVSTGGGASLEFLEGKELPGVAALNDK